MPYRVENLHGEDIDSLAAAKFHSAAVSRDGLLFTWGFGRGGRLGKHGSTLSAEKSGHEALWDRSAAMT